MTNIISNKYPKTPYLPFSESVSIDDERLMDCQHLLNKPLIVTEKLDGSNLCYTRSKSFARSHTSEQLHYSFSYAKAKHAEIKDLIPDNLSVFLEYCYAIHTIEYDKGLPSYLFLIGARNDITQEWFSWDMLHRIGFNLNIPLVPVIGCLIAKDEQEFKKLLFNYIKQPSFFGKDKEGVVVRVMDSFVDTDFNKSVAKWVRKDHVAGEHWTASNIKKQLLVK